MNTKNNTLPVLVAAIMAAAWLNNFSAGTPTAPAHPSPLPAAVAPDPDDDDDDGGICLDTKFFFPRTTRSAMLGDNNHRQKLTDVLRAYETQ